MLARRNDVANLPARSLTNWENGAPLSYKNTFPLGYANPSKRNRTPGSFRAVGEVTNTDTEPLPEPPVPEHSSAYA